LYRNYWYPCCTIVTTHWLDLTAPASFAVACTVNVEPTAPVTFICPVLALIVPPVPEIIAHVTVLSSAFAGVIVVALTVAVLHSCIDNVDGMVIPVTSILGFVTVTFTVLLVSTPFVAVTRTVIVTSVAKATV
jgi:hypothetical protein